MDRLMTLLALPPLSLRTSIGDEFANKSVIVIVIVSTRAKLAVGTLIEAKIGIIAEIGIGVESTGSTSIRASIHTGGHVQGTGGMMRMGITADTGTAAALGIAIESTDMVIEIVRTEIGTATETMIVTVAETTTGNVASVRGKKETN